jgi:hypothetical protein
METIEEIVREMRGRGEDHRVDRELWKKYADRIEVAVAKMETTTSTCKDSLQVGNMAEMRVALNAVIDACDTMLKMKRDAEFVEKWAVSVRNIVNKALKCPPRNCDLPSVIEKPHSAWLSDRDNWDELGNPKKEIYDWLFAEAKGEIK